MRGLPAGWYLDPTRGPLEYSAIIAPAWQLACHVADLPAPGTAARFDCAGRSAFVLRGRDGALRAYRNACRHRGSRLVDGDLHTGFAFCVDARVRCPYHGWTYDDRGALESVPAEQHFEPAELAGVALESLPVVQWRGLVFLALGPAPVPFEAWLGVAADVWPDATSLRRFGEPRAWAIAADWKLACEHLLDASHARVVRARPNPRIFGAPRFGATSVEAAALHATSDAVPGGGRTWPARAYLARLARSSMPARATSLYVWPNLLLRTTPDGISALQVLPGQTGRCTLRLTRYGSPDVSREMRALRYLQSRVERRLAADDVRLLERTQSGLASLDADHSAPIDADEAGLQWFAARCRSAGQSSSMSLAARTGRRRSQRPRRATLQSG